MKSSTKINSDLFNISKRLKTIDKNYFIVFSNKYNRYEIHNSSQVFNTLSVICPYKTLDKRVLDFVLQTKVENSEKILNEIEANNMQLQNDAQQKALDKSESMLKDIYSYVKGNKSFDYKKAFLIDWS